MWVSGSAVTLLTAIMRCTPKSSTRKEGRVYSVEWFEAVTFVMGKARWQEFEEKVNTGAVITVRHSRRQVNAGAQPSSLYSV